VSGSPKAAIHTSLVAVMSNVDEPSWSVCGWWVGEGLRAAVGGMAGGRARVHGGRARFTSQVKSSQVKAGFAWSVDSTGVPWGVRRWGPMEGGLHLQRRFDWDIDERAVDG
jgi:hypothetical protein